MISWSLFSLFFVASTLNCLTPGLGYFYVMGIALQKGLRASLPAVAGITVGVALLQVASLAGLGVIVANCPTLYALIKLTGAIFLIYMGVMSWRKAKKTTPSLENLAKENESTICKGMGLMLANPQPLIFTISLFPQFISMQHDYTVQVGIMIAVYAMLEIAGSLFYAVLASTARNCLRSVGAARLLNQAVAVIFVLIGVTVLVYALAPFIAT